MHVNLNATASGGLAVALLRTYLCIANNKGHTMQSIFEILLMLIGVARFFIFAHFIMSWLISFDVLNVRQPVVGQIWNMLQRILEPLYAPIRRVMPNLGGIDLSPIAALLALEVLRIVLINNASAFF
ncbi:MAG: YggT family protein [Yoonia sp.]